MKIAMIFPGYSSQFVGMCKEFYDEHRIVQEFFEEASNCLNINFVKLCFASSDAELGRPHHAYPAIFLVSSAISALLKQEGINPDIMAGYNQGEFSAIYAADGMTFPDGLYLLNKYATLYQDLLSAHPYAAVRIKGIATKDLQDACLKAQTEDDSAALDIAIMEASDVNVVTGDYQAIERLRDLVGLESSVSIDGVPIEIGLHSSRMDGVVEQLRMYMEKVDCKNLRVPMCEGINGLMIEQHHEVREHIIRQINNPILWTRVMRKLSEYDLIIEIGPGTSLHTLMQKYYPQQNIISVSKPDDLKILKEKLSLKDSNDSSE